MTERVVREAAAAGNCVIVGRGSQHFFAQDPNAMRVFLYAPREDKVRRLIARGKSEDEAQQLVDTVDRERADFIQKYFQVEWPTRFLYHLMLNTSIGEEAAVQTILNFMTSLDSKHDLETVQRSS
jgi:cytidylate kinase